MIPLPLYSSGFKDGKLTISNDWFNAGIVVMRHFICLFFYQYCGCFAQTEMFISCNVLYTFYNKMSFCKHFELRNTFGNIAHICKIYLKLYSILR